MKRISILFLIIQILTACQPDDTVQLVTIENKYAVSIPSFLVKSGTTLNENASLEYLHTWKDFYVIVIDEPVSDFQKALIEYDLTTDYRNEIDGYSKLILGNFLQSQIISNKSKILKTTINNMPARLINFNSYVDGTSVYYSLAIFQGKETYYQILAWTVSSKKSDYEDKMLKIIYSFKEL